MAAITLRVNGRTHEVQAQPGDNLLTVLRDDLGLTGTKYGCGEGMCGACTVLIDGQPTRSCVTRVGSLQGKSIATIESIGAGDRLHPVQQAFIDAEAYQCGYCTPGMVMATIGLLETRPNPTDEDVARVLDRNVCRCGTYPRIVEAIRRASRQMSETAGAGRARRMR